MTKKKRNILVSESRNATALCSLFLAVIALSGCNSASLQEFVRGPDLKGVGAMAHEPITRLAFVPAGDDAGKITLVIERPAQGDNIAQDMAEIETASGEGRKAAE